MEVAESEERGAFSAPHLQQISGYVGAMVCYILITH